MGTNYYTWNDEPCPTCGHGQEQLHIGKSSWGWCFSLHAIPELGLVDWRTWKAFLADRKIFNEYNEAVPFIEFVKVVEDRQNRYGPLGRELERHVIDGGYCIAHGSGTWDMIEGKFS